MRVICDHPGWDITSTPRRALYTGHGIWTTTAATALTLTPVGEVQGPTPVVDTYFPDDLGPQVPQKLRQALDAQGPVQRLRTPDLWEALATAIIRQVIRADQARKMFARFCLAHGTQLPGFPAVFPRPHTVLALHETAFTELGMAFKRRPLIAAAEAYLEFGHKWIGLPPEDLRVEVQAVPRIGPWTAGAAVADITNDFSLYPYGDLAVRTWATRVAPDIDWPTDEATFAAWWRSFAQTSRQLSTLTVLTLALGGSRGQDPTPS